MRILFLGDVVGISGRSMLLNNLLSKIKDKKIDFVINTTSGIRSLTDSFAIRKATVASRILHATTVESALMICQAIEFQNTNGSLSTFGALQNIK